jgi:hypothetical protein
MPCFSPPDSQERPNHSVYFDSDSAREMISKSSMITPPLAVAINLRNGSWTLNRLGFGVPQSYTMYSQ